MNLYVRVAVAGIVLAAAAGCSYTTLFVIVNHSKEPIRIAYSVRRLDLPPAVKALRDLTADDRPWRELDVPHLSQDKNIALTLVLGPDSALRVASTAAPGLFNVVSVEFRTQGGQRTFRGDEAQRAFKESSRTQHTGISVGSRKPPNKRLN